MLLFLFHFCAKAYYNQTFDFLMFVAKVVENSIVAFR